VVQLSLHKTEVTEDLCWNWRWTLQTFTVTVVSGAIISAQFGM